MPPIYQHPPLTSPHHCEPFEMPPNPKDVSITEEYRRRPVPSANCSCDLLVARRYCRTESIPAAPDGQPFMGVRPGGLVRTVACTVGVAGFAFVADTLCAAWGWRMGGYHPSSSTKALPGGCWWMTAFFCFLPRHVPMPQHH